MGTDSIPSPTHNPFQPPEGDDTTFVAVCFEECTAATIDSFGTLLPDPETAEPLRAFDEEVERPDGTTETVRRERWLYVFRVEEAGRGEAPVTDFNGWTTPESETVPDVLRLDDGTERKVAVSEYTVNANGRYRRVRGEGNDRSLSEWAAKAVYLVTKTPYDHGIDHFVHLARHPLAKARIDDLKRRLLRGGRPRPVTPVDLTGEYLIAPTVAVAGEGAAVVAIRLAEPHRLARQRLAAAEAAQERYRAWTEKLKGAAGTAGLIGTPCYDAAHRRTYLGTKLAAKVGYHPNLPDEVDHTTPRPRVREKTIDPEVDMNAEDTWGEFSLREATGSEHAPTEPAGDHLLAHFQYGAACQRVTLRQARIEATEAAEALMQTPAFRAAVDDAATYTEAAAEALPGPPAGAVADQVLQLFARLAGAGGGGAMMARILQASGLIRAGAEMTPAKVEALIADLEAIAEEDPAALLEAKALLPKALKDRTALKVLLILARRATKAPAAFTIAVAPAAQTFTLGGSLQRSGPPRAALFLAALLQTTHPGGDGTYTIHTGSREWRIRGPRSEIVLAKMRWTEIEHHVPVRGTGWRLNATGQLKVDLQEAGTALGLTNRFRTRATGVLEAINVLLAGGRIARSHAQGRLALGDGIAAMQALTSVASPVGAAAEQSAWLRLGRRKLARRAAGETAIEAARRVGGALTAASPFFDALMAAYGAAAQWTDVDQFGQVAVKDANVWGGLGELALGAGGALIGAAVLGPAGIVAGAAGVGLTAGGGLLLWGAEGADLQARKEADPLWTWLPKKTFWGQDPEPGRRISTEQRTRLFDLVRPGQADEAGPVPDDLATQMGREAEEFVETAFWFPASAQVKHPEGATARTAAPDGLRLSVALGYLPDYGTVMVSARAGSGEEVQIPIECAVHYVKTADHVRYCAYPEGENLEIPEDTSLRELAEQDNWARAATRPVELPSGPAGEAAHLQIHVGEWPARWHPDEEREQAKHRIEIADLHDPDAWAKAYRDARPEAYRDLTEGERWGRDVLRAVDPKSVLEAPDGLDDVLRSGRFRVSGTVGFAPLRPFDPRPSVEEYDGATQLIAQEGIDFNYPADA